MVVTPRVASALLLLALFQASNAQTPLRVLRTDGIGSVRIGDTLPVLGKKLGTQFHVPKDDDSGGACFDIEPKNEPGISFMMLNGKLARIDIFKHSKVAIQGISIGDTEKKAIAAFHLTLRVTSSAYAAPEGHYLTSITHGGTRVRFETQNGVVTRFYAGTKQATSYIEGCL